MEKSYFDVIKERYSCRKFKDIPVEKEKIDKILDSALLAPTAVNFQPEKIFVIEDSEVLEKLKEATRFTFDAKLIFAICYDDRISWHRKNDGYDHGIVDASIITTHMMLAATALGLGTTYVCSFREQMIKDILGLDNNMHVAALLPCGYPDEIKPHNDRKNKEEVVVWK